MTSPLPIVVIIPALNEESSLPLVLSQLPEVRNVVVVDNGSRDRTAKVAVEHGATVVDQPRRGYGSACLAGLEYVNSTELDERGGVQAVAFIDGDYSDSPELLRQLAEPVLSGRSDFVLGSRLLGQREPGAMPPQSVWGNRLACFLMRIIWGVPYTDLGPFRVIRPAALRQLEMSDTNYGWTIEMQIKAALHGLRIVEKPVPYRCRVGKSKISGTIRGTFLAGKKILWTIARYWWLTRHRRIAVRPTYQREEIEVERLENSAATEQIGHIPPQPNPRPADSVSKP